MKHLFIGGPWDGQVHDLASELGVTDAQHRSAVSVPNQAHKGAVTQALTLYYPRKYRWATERGGVEIEVMSSSISEPLGGQLLLHLFRLAGLDVTWTPDTG